MLLNTTDMTIRPAFLMSLLVFMALELPGVGMAEGADSSCFDGNWEWIAKATNKDGTPAGTCELSLTTNGKELLGKVSASQGYGARFEEGSTVAGTVISPRKAELRFGSLRGAGQIVAQVSCRGSNLLWEIISDDVNDNAFPDKVTLRRTR
jgi:hypothetical protein